ncbi:MULTISPECIES: YgjV family protein [unclassified Halomonas]|uniref:YgjV family protein n=1 Tax=unclassified Halomonas TaxID=2609666 RepID=UPI001EF5E8FE|nr:MULTISPECIES: YgjV family protein [unclassified Halomonas]MCO7215223.1 YgjV family protein [Halomonas sp. OfavH-34-E]
MTDPFSIAWGLGMEEMGLRWLAGQAVSLVALTLCVIGFASRHDDKLLVLLLGANLAFATQFALLGSWVAASISALIILRIALARRFPGNLAIMLGMLLATLLVAALTWSDARDLPALAAGLLGTFAMFMLRGVAMRLVLAGAAFCWIISNLLAGSLGGTLAETLIFATNIITIVRLRRQASVAAH